MDRIVFHLDMDAFYAAVEEREHPELKGKPVVIGADPKKGKGRGVVSTANYKAREFGIRSGMPISIAYRKCPDAVFLPVNMKLYWQVSQRIINILRNYAKKLQQVSVDEAFFECSAKSFDEAEKIAFEIKRQILEKENLTCSIGIGPNKLVAKIASDYKKPNGLTVVMPENVKKFLDPLPVRKLYGIGPKTEYALKHIGIETIGQLSRYDKERLFNYFGKSGIVMHNYANGVDDSEIIENSDSKSIGREVTFERDTDDFDSLRQVVDEIADDIYNTTKEEKYTFRTVVLKIRFQGFETHTKQKSWKREPSLPEIKNTAHDILSSMPKKKVRLIGLRLTNLKRQ